MFNYLGGLAGLDGLSPKYPKYNVCLSGRDRYVRCDIDQLRRVSAHADAPGRKADQRTRPRIERLEPQEIVRRRGRKDHEARDGRSYRALRCMLPCRARRHGQGQGHPWGGPIPANREWQV